MAINPFIPIQTQAPVQPQYYQQYNTPMPEPVQPRKIEIEMEPVLNMKFFEKDVYVDDPVVGEQAEVTTTKKRGRPRKDQSANSVAMVKANEEAAMVANGEISYANSSVPYAQSFKKTNEMLESSIYQIDALSNEVHTELENVRNSRTLKGRYTYISDLTSTASSLLTTKISAIREMNSVIQQGHKLDLDRIKALKLDQANAMNDDMQIQALYNAYINTPISSGYNPLAYDTKGAIMGGSNMANIVRADVGTVDGYDAYAANITPEQNRMLMENNPNIKTVVVYDQTNPNNRYFDVIDTTTGQSVPNYPRPDPILMEDTTINPITGMARNSNINASWPVITVGNPDLANF